jgi:hypothetical protein
VDIILEDAAGQLVGVEVKASATVTSSDFKGLRALQEMTGKLFKRGVIFYNGTETVAFGSNLSAVPIIESLAWRGLRRDIPIPKIDGKAQSILLSHPTEVITLRSLSDFPLPRVVSSPTPRS